MDKKEFLTDYEVKKQLTNDKGSGGRYMSTQEKH